MDNKELDAIRGLIVEVLDARLGSATDQIVEKVHDKFESKFNQLSQSLQGLSSQQAEQVRDIQRNMRRIRRDMSGMESRIDGINMARSHGFVPGSQGQIDYSGYEIPRTRPPIAMLVEVADEVDAPPYL